MKSEFLDKLYAEHQICDTCPPPEEVHHFFRQILGVLYLDYAKKPLRSLDAIDQELKRLEKELESLLHRNPMNAVLGTTEIAGKFFQNLPAIYELLNKDITAIFKGDPACTGRREVIRTYPGFYAIAAYRVAHHLHQLGVEDLPRIITEHAHSRTGVDIHPGATIGESCCIDHGTGIVIGETAIIKNHVKIYQGVTLGALSVKKCDKNIQRHPTIEEHCVLYAGSTILGGETVIGHHSVIGGNVWITKSVPPHSKIYYQAAMSNNDNGGTDIMVFKDFAR